MKALLEIFPLTPLNDSDSLIEKLIHLFFFNWILLPPAIPDKNLAL